MTLWIALACLSAGTKAQTLSAPAVVSGEATTPAQKASATATLGSLHGTVTGPQGALMAGAQVTLAPTGSPSRTLLTDRDGRFFFPNVSPGAFTVTVTLQGFDPVSVTSVLSSGQSLEMQPLLLRLSTVSFAVDAVVSTEELATEQLHIEESQRLLGVLPNFFVSYNWTAPPLSSKQKFTLAWKNASDPGNLLLVGTVAGVQQAANAFPGYHQGAKGYGRRYGADLGNLVVGTFMGGAVLPSLFHQDPRYFYKGTGTVRSRALYAISTAVICRGDNGHRQPAFAGVLGDLSAGAISNLYYAPSDRQGATLTLVNGILAIGGDAMNNLFQEFVLGKLTTRANSRANKKSRHAENAP